MGSASRTQVRSVPPAPATANVCFGGYQCNAAGACVGVQPKVCTALDQCHDAGTCNPSTGLCSNPDQPNGMGCVDPNRCKHGTVCRNGVCTAMQEEICPQQWENPCRSESGQCDPQTGLCEYSASPAGEDCSTPMLYPCTNSTCDGAGTCNRGGDICDSECQYCSESRKRVFRYSGRGLTSNAKAAWASAAAVSANLPAEARARRKRMPATRSWIPVGSSPGTTCAAPATLTPTAIAAGSTMGSARWSTAYAGLRAFPNAAQCLPGTLQLQQDPALGLAANSWAASREPAPPLCRLTAVLWVEKADPVRWP